MEENNLKSVLSVVNERFSLEQQDPHQMPGLALAYVGDCIFELVVRTMLLGQGLTHVSELHKKASAIVRASAQKDLFFKIEKELSEEELAVFRRGRNVKSSRAAKNADIVDYRIATGLEALMGFLYLSDRIDRIAELVKMGLEDRD
ncbi:MAG: ribonuclease III [Lachnospiraceae bacterium]|nr:ribonuclease III [Lachnospiraceae bacterium]